MMTPKERRELYAKRLAEGICPRCGRNPICGYNHCYKCRVKKQKQKISAYQRRKNNGQCVRCGIKIEFVRCKKCSDKRNLLRRKKTKHIGTYCVVCGIDNKELTYCEEGYNICSAKCNDIWRK